MGASLLGMPRPVGASLLGMPRPVGASLLAMLQCSRCEAKASRSRTPISTAEITNVMCSTTYHDTFVRDGGQWRFVGRVIYPNLVGDLSRHRSDMA